MVKVPDLLRQICSIKPEDVATVRSSELLAKLELEDLDLILRERRLRWDLLCVQLASYLERGPLKWMMPLHLHVNQKSNYDDDDIIKVSVTHFCMLINAGFLIKHVWYHGFNSLSEC